MTGYESKKAAAQAKMTDDEYGELAERYAKAISKDINRMADDICKRFTFYNDLTPEAQGLVKRTALAHASKYLGGFNKE